MYIHLWKQKFFAETLYRYMIPLQIEGSTRSLKVDGQLVQDRIQCLIGWLSPFLNIDRDQVEDFN